MRYVADGDDKAIFDSAEECLAHEARMRQWAEVEAQVNQYLDLQPYPKDPKSAQRERTKDYNAINGWIQHDMRQRPGRYGIEYDEPETPYLAPVDHVEDVPA